MSRSDGPTRTRAAGVAMAALYLAAMTATMRLGPARVRPLYEGFTPPPPYQWVNPPKEFRSGNQKPVPVDTDIALKATGSIAIGVTSSDSQFILNLPDGAIPVHAPDLSANAHIEPLDPAKLGTIPDGLAADGNAYRLQLTYQPSKTEITRLVKPGNVFLTVPQPSSTLFSSVNGREWKPLSAQHAGGPGVLGAQLTDTGWFVAAMPRSAAAKRGSPIGTIAVAVVTVLLALALFFGPAAFRRLRGGNAPPTPARRASGRPRQPAPRRQRGGRPPRRRGG